MTEEKLKEATAINDRIKNLKKAREMVSLFKGDSGIKIRGANYKNEEIHLTGDNKRLLLQWIDDTLEEDIRRTEEKFSRL